MVMKKMIDIEEPGIEERVPLEDCYGSLRAANLARQREWCQNEGEQVDLGPSFRGNELAGEMAETLIVCNTIKKLHREQLGLRGSRVTLDQLADELCDVMICVDLTAMEFGIDLEAHLARKFNKTSRERGLKTRLIRKE